MSFQLYTVGHSNHSFEILHKLLVGVGTTVLVDVRTKPYSRAKHFCRSSLRILLRQSGIEYKWAGEHLGGMGKTSVESAIFLDKIGKVTALAEEGVATIMCSEHDPRDCHRASKLCAWYHRNTDLYGVHITREGELIDSRILEKQIIPAMMWWEYGGSYGK